MASIFRRLGEFLGISAPPLSKEFANEIEKQIRNSAQHHELIQKLKDFLNDAENRLKKKRWVSVRSDESIPTTRELYISSTPHDQGLEGTCYAFAVATVVRATLNLIEGFPTPSHENLRQMLISKFGKKGAFCSEALEYLKNQHHYPIEWKVEENINKIQAILKDQKNKRPYIASISWCPHNRRASSGFFCDQSGKIMKGSDLPCQRTFCQEKLHHDPAKIEVTGHAVVLERDLYLDSKKCWRLKNSYGAAYGDGGSFMIEPDVPGIFRLIDVFPSNKKHNQGPQTVEIKGETYTYYKTNWLGKGIYFAQKSGTMTKYVIKIVELDYASGRESARKEMKAHQIFKQDGHENIVKFIASAVVDNKLFIVLKYYESSSLLQKIFDGQVFPIHTALLYLKESAQGLAYIHSKSAIHGDIHADNILIDNNICCITDFGRTTFPDDRDEEIDIRSAFLPYFPILKKLIYFLIVPLCLLAAFFYPSLQGLKDYLPLLLVLFGCLSFGVICDHVRKLEKKKFRSYRTDISAFGKVAVAMMLGRGFQNCTKHVIASRFKEDLTVAPLRDLCLSMLDDNPEERPSAQEIVTRISRLIKEGNQIYRSHIFSKLPEGMYSPQDIEVIKMIGIASTCLYNRIFKEYSRV